MRVLAWLLRVIAGASVALVVYGVLLMLTFFIDGTEGCGEGSCNFIGEAAQGDVTRWFMGGVFVAVSATCGVLTARAV